MTRAARSPDGEPRGHALIAHDALGRRFVFPLPHDASEVLVGRSESNDVCLPWDAEVSRTHARVERIGESWTVVDDGISRNGTLCNGERLRGRRRLDDGDIIRMGRTDVVFRAPPDHDGARTAMPPPGPLVTVSPAQRRVLVALARPYGAATGFPVPASNQAIAAELCVSLEAVKGHLRALFGKFALGGLPQNQKRARLVEEALRHGVVSLHDLQ